MPGGGGQRTLTGEHVVDARLRQVLQKQYETFVAKEELQDFEAALAEILAGWLEELGAEGSRAPVDETAETGPVEEGEWAEPGEGSAVELSQTPDASSAADSGQGTVPGRVEQGPGAHQGPPARVDSVREAAGWSLVWGLERKTHNDKNTYSTGAAAGTGPAGVRASTEKNI